MIAYNFITSKDGVFNIHIFDSSGFAANNYNNINYHKKIAPILV